MTATNIAEFFCRAKTFEGSSDVDANRLVDAALALALERPCVRRRAVCCRTWPLRRRECSGGRLGVGPGDMAKQQSSSERLDPAIVDDVDYELLLGRLLSNRKSRLLLADLEVLIGAAILRRRPASSRTLSK